MAQGLLNDAILSRSVGLIVAAITTRNILESCAGEDLRGYLALHLIECLTQLLRGTTHVFIIVSSKADFT